jgi:hypothetical protein
MNNLPPSPTYLAMALRKQWSDEHLFEDAGYHPGCARCGKAWNHPNHVTRDEDKAAVQRWRDNINGE